MIEVTCTNCGNSFQRKPSEMKSKKSYCSWACRYGNRPSKVEVACYTCGEKFLRFRSLVRERQYCSKACQIAARPANVQLTCHTCGKEFVRWACLVIEKREGVFCSRACASEGHKRLNTVHCTTCNKAIIRRDSEVQKSAQPFCSKACQGVWIAEHESKSVTVSCAQCNKPIRCKQYKLKQNSQFCSRECQHEWQSLNWIGPNHHGWKGGSAALQDYGPNWKQQARAARIRDGHKCRLCGAAQKKHRRSFDVHHVKSFRTFGYARGKNTNYKAANELTNLVTLCRTCHPKVEHGKIAIQPYLL